MNSPHTAFAAFFLALTLGAGCDAELGSEPLTKKPNPKKPAKKILIVNPIAEASVRDAAAKPTGPLTDSDLKRVSMLHLTGIQITNEIYLFKELKLLETLILSNTQITDLNPLKELRGLRRLSVYESQISDVSALKELTQLTTLNLYNNPGLTKTQIAELQKALPKCKIEHNATK